MIDVEKKMNVDATQTTVIHTMLFQVIRLFVQKMDIDKVDASQLTNFWLKRVVKPDWMEERKLDIHFIAAVNEFFCEYKSNLKHLKIEKGELEIYKTHDDIFSDIEKGNLEESSTFKITIE